ncbi:MAG: hypothetical protein FWD57_15995, partial [Polyangiaceae bacterium]|nr:hypothetical protein [Polyangiaceae bacterium]
MPITQYKFQWEGIALPSADASDQDVALDLAGENVAQSSEDTILPVFPVLPNPSPLPASVAHGVFGTDEDQLPIDPTPEEIEAITAAHAEKLLDLHDVIIETELALAVRQDPHRWPLYQTKDQAVSAY